MTQDRKQILSAAFSLVKISYDFKKQQCIVLQSNHIFDTFILLYLLCGPLCFIELGPHWL